MVVETLTKTVSALCQDCYKHVRTLCFYSGIPVSEETKGEVSVQRVVGGRTEGQAVTGLVQNPVLWNGLNSDFIFPFRCLDIKVIRSFQYLKFCLCRRNRELFNRDLCK